MAIQLPNGALVAIASGYGTSKTMSAVTNANPGVATLEAGHDVTDNDILEVTSGWSRLTERIVKAGTVATNDVPLTGINTTSTSLFPAGAGVGSVREITGWTTLGQILNTSSSGGEQQFYEYQFLESDSMRRVPTVKSAQGLTLTIGDDTSLAGYQLAETANDDRQPRAVRITLPNGALIYFSAVITVGKTPTLTVNEAMTVDVTFSYQNDPVRYTS